MEVYRKEICVGPEGLGTRELFRLLQDAAGEQCVPLQLAGPDLEKMGLMWVIIKYRVQADRWPQPGERLILRTWPGRTRHGMMPRFYAIRDEAGETCVAASSVWAVVDRHTRAMVRSEELGGAFARLEPLETGEEIRLPGAVRRLETAQSADFTVPADYLDENGHMNNPHYYTVAERCIGRDARRDGLREAATEHLSEALCGETLSLRWGEQDGLWYILGEHEGKPVFRMNLRYG